MNEKLVGRTQHRVQPEDRLPDRLLAHAVALALKITQLRQRLAVGAAPGEPHRADRLRRGAAARTGDAADGDAELDVKALERPFGHLHHHRLTDGALGDERLRAHAQQSLLDYIGVGDHAAGQPLGGPGAAAENLGDAAAGAGFGGGHAPAQLRKPSTERVHALQILLRWRHRAPPPDCP